MSTPHPPPGVNPTQKCAFLLQTNLQVNRPLHHGSGTQLVNPYGDQGTYVTLELELGSGDSSSTEQKIRYKCQG